MTKVVGYSSEEDFRRAANVIRYVERGGIDHPYYRRQAPMGEEGCDCCDGVYGMSHITEQVTDVSATAYFPPRLQVDIPALDASPFDLWLCCGHSLTGPPQTNVYRSSQFNVENNSTTYPAHWEINNIGTVFRLFLVLDEPFNVSVLKTATCQYINMDIWDIQADNRMQLELRSQANSEPLNILEKFACVKIVDLPDSFSTLPMNQLWGGTPPSQIHVTKNGGGLKNLNLQSSAHLQEYGKGVSDGYRFGAVFADGEVDTANCCLVFQTSGSARFLCKEMPFASPLDITVTDAHGDAYRFYE